MTWKHPFTCTIAGPSSSGKTSFVLKFIKHAIIVPPPTSILWCYGTFQEIFNTIDNVEFHEGIPEVSQLKKGLLLILDDLMHEADDRVNKIFTKHSHHMDVSVMFLTHDYSCTIFPLRSLSFHTS
jgi:GTPase SAR1 family protein